MNCEEYMEQKELYTALRRADSGEPLQRADALQLLAIQNGSRAYYELLGIANRDARRRYSGRGYIFAPFL